MPWLIILVAIVVAVGAVMWLAITSPPTRPRPDSRYRGSTYMSVNNRLRRRGR
jgi:hypothetical protein